MVQYALIVAGGKGLRMGTDSVAQTKTEPPPPVLFSS